MSQPIGGQAVLEGVMMRGPSAWSVAVRKPDGAIAEVNRPIASVLLRHRWLRIPVVRGVVALGESLAIGFRALAISANYAAQQEGDDGEVLVVGARHVGAVGAGERQGHRSRRSGAMAGQLLVEVPRHGGIIGTSARIMPFGQPLAN